MIVVCTGFESFSVGTAYYFLSLPVNVMSCSRSDGKWATKSITKWHGSLYDSAENSFLLIKLRKKELESLVLERNMMPRNIMSALVRTVNCLQAPSTTFQGLALIWH